MQFIRTISKKIILAVAILTTIGAAFGVQWYFRTGLQYHNSPPVSIQEIVDADTALQSAQADSDQPANSLPVLPTTVAATLPVSDIEHSSPQGLNPVLLSMLEEINSGLKQQHDAFLYFDDRLQPVRDLLPKLESAVALQSAATEHLEDRIVELESEILNMTAIITEAQHTNVQTALSTPPFRLIAIDRWNNEWNAVIEFEGKITMISTQSARAGWRLVTIDPNTHSAQFQSTTGNEAILSVSG